MREVCRRSKGRERRLLHRPGNEYRREYSRKNRIETMEEQNRVEKDGREKVGSGD